MKPINELIIEREDNFLHLHYHPKTDYVHYDLCDVSGKIRLSGQMDKLSPTKANIQSLAEGDYQIFIIDGEEIIKKSIRL